MIPVHQPGWATLSAEAPAVSVQRKNKTMKNSKGKWVLKSIEE